MTRSAAERQGKTKISYNHTGAKREINEWK